MVAALDLPELRTYVGLFLDEQDLAVCLCVCREWHATFMPLRWRTIQIAGIHSVRADVNLRRHASLVRSISFLRIISLRHFSNVGWYNQLERIHITRPDIDGRKMWDKLSMLVQQNARTLKTLVLKDMTPLREFLIALGDNGHKDVDGGRGGVGALELDSLKWKRVTVSALSHELFWKACQSARTLVLECMTIKGMGMVGGTPLAQDEFESLLTTGSASSLASASAPSSLSGPGPFSSSPSLHTLATGLGTSIPLSTTLQQHPNKIQAYNQEHHPQQHQQQLCRIQHLRVSWMIDLSLEFQLLFWIRPCSQLCSLVWHAFAFPSCTMMAFARLLAATTWQFLTALELSSCVTQQPSDDSLARVLDALPNPLSRLCLRNVDFGPQAFESLKRRGRPQRPRASHLSSLKTLSWITCGTKVNSAMAREVLESCTQLQFFQAPYLLVEDMRVPQDENQMKSKENEPDGEQNHLSRPQEPCGANYETIATVAPSSLRSLPDDQENHSPPSLSSTPKPWVCLDLRSLFIAAAVASYASPPLTQEEEAVIWRRLKPLKKLKNFRVGVSVSSACPSPLRE